MPRKLNSDRVEEILARLRYYRSASCTPAEVSETAKRLEEDNQNNPHEYARAMKLWTMLYAPRKERQDNDR